MAFAFLSGSLFNAFADISVAIKPGAIQFTLMPLGESSVAIALVIPSIADFDAVYAITFGMPYCEAIELMLIMLPFTDCCSITRTTSLEIANTADTFVCRIF